MRMMAVSRSFLILAILNVTSFVLSSSPAGISFVRWSIREKGVRSFDGLECYNDGLIPDAKDCAVYYRCYWSNGPYYILFQLQCPNGTLFDPESDACNFPSAVNPHPGCSSGNLIPPEVISTTETSSTTEQPPEVTPISTVPPEEEATMASTMSTTTEESHPSTEVSTALPTSTEGTPPNASAIQFTLHPASQFNCVLPGNVPHPSSCIRFYRCYEVQPGLLYGLLYRCPAGYGFSAQKERCHPFSSVPGCYEKLRRHHKGPPSTRYLSFLPALHRRGRPAANN